MRTKLKVRLMIFSFISILGFTYGFLPIKALINDVSDQAKISIDGNTDFHNTVSTEGWLGDGSVGDPYIISDLILEGSDDHLIFINNTDVYFHIENLILKGSETNIGVYFNNVLHGSIIDSKITNCRTGVYLTESNDTHIRNNILDSNGENVPLGQEVIEEEPFYQRWERSGIYLDHSNHTLIENNVIQNSYVYGVYFFNSDHNKILNNTIRRSNYQGIFLSGEQNLISENIISEHLTGILMGRNYEWFELLGASGVTHKVLLTASRNELIGNYIYNNEAGTNIGAPSVRNIVSNNTIANSRYEGMAITDYNTNYGLPQDAKNNQIIYNNFVRNNYDGIPGSSQVRDAGTDTNVSTNYWNDWITPDLDINGIVDSPYSISGLPNNQDLFPRVSQNQPLIHLIHPIIIYPSTSITLSGEVILEWEPAIDQLVHGVTSTLLVSAENNDTWIEIASGLENSSFTWDTYSVPNGSYLFKVICTCSEGLEIYITNSNVFYIDNEPTTASTSDYSSIWILGLFILLLIKRRKKR